MGKCACAHFPILFSGLRRLTCVGPNRSEFLIPFNGGHSGIATINSRSRASHSVCSH